MIISIFEERDFISWCKNDIELSKKIIFNRAHILLMSVTLSNKKSKEYTKVKDFINNHLDTIELEHEITNNNKTGFNCCLFKQCINIIYDKPRLLHSARQEGLSTEILKSYMKELSNFITDSVITEWKMIRNLTFNFVKVSYPRSENRGFFPVSSNLKDLIKVIEKLSKKKVIFTPEKRISAEITKTSIICYFSTNRLDSEYIIQQQLIELYLHFKGYHPIKKTYFTDETTWVLNEENLRDAILLIIQNKFSHLLASEVYPVFNECILYNLLNLKYNEKYITSAIKYICEFNKQNKSCVNCKGIEDIFTTEHECPLYSNSSILTKEFSLNELSSLIQQQKLCDKFLSDIL